MGLQPGRAPPSLAHSSGDISIRVGNVQNPSCVSRLIGKENSWVFFGCAPDTTPTTTLFFSEPKTTMVSGSPSQVTSATIAGLLFHLTAGCDFSRLAYPNIRLGYLRIRGRGENGRDEEDLREFHVNTFRREVRRFRLTDAFRRLGSLTRL